MEWRTIDSAPKDYSDILVARFDEDGSYWCAVAQWYVEQWAFANSTQPHMVLLCFDPTHWQSLPSPPITETQSEG